MYHIRIISFAGDSRTVDVAAIHRHGQLQSVATTMVSYGYFGDLLKTSEQWRKLGPTRYIVSGVLQFLRNRSYEGQLKVLTPAMPLAQPYDVNVCSHQCSVCDKAAKTAPTPGNWLQVIFFLKSLLMFQRLFISGLVFFTNILLDNQINAFHYGLSISVTVDRLTYPSFHINSGVLEGTRLLPSPSFLSILYSSLFNI